MKKNLLSLLCVILLSVKGEAVSKYYSQLYGNICHNGYIDAPSPKLGVIAFKITPVYESKSGRKNLLTSPNALLLDTWNNVIAFSYDGKEMWRHKKSPKIPAICEKNSVFIVSAESYADLLGICITDGKQETSRHIPNISETGSIELLEITENGFMAHLFIRSPSGPCMQYIYKFKDKRLGYFDWQNTFDIELGPLLSIGCPSVSRILITSPLNKVLIFDTDLDIGPLKSADPTAQFPIPLGEKALWVSCDEKGQALWSGNEGHTILLAVTDLTGGMIWNWSSNENEFNLEAQPIAPPIVGTDAIFLVTKRKIFAISKGTLLWTFHATVEDISHASACNDGTILVSLGSKLVNIDKNGEKKFKIDIKENIECAPVASNSGIAYVCGTKSIFAIK